MKQFSKLENGDIVTYVNAVNRPDGKPVILSFSQGEVIKKEKTAVLVKPFGRRKPIRVTRQQLSNNAIYSI